MVLKGFSVPLDMGGLLDQQLNEVAEITKQLTDRDAFNQKLFSHVS